MRYCFSREVEDLQMTSGKTRSFERTKKRWTTGSSAAERMTRSVEISCKLDIFWLIVSKPSWTSHSFLCRRLHSLKRFVCPENSRDVDFLWTGFYGMTLAESHTVHAIRNLGKDATERLHKTPRPILERQIVD